MRHSAIRISNSYEVSQAWRASLAKGKQVFGAAKVSPDEMGGYFDLRDWRGQPISRDYFLGRWTFLYFGYSRCMGSCRVAAPVMARGAEILRARGFSARAAFVDIETQPVSTPQMIVAGEDGHEHASNWPMRFAMSQLFDDHGGRLDVLTGSRAQLARATTAFHVLREHVPPRSGEDGGSINHSSMIYLIGPDMLVAAYGYHDVGPDMLVLLVEQLDKAERNDIDFAAIRRRYFLGACGSEA